MPIVYTNRKGLTYTLCRGTTKTGKPRYFFAKEPKGAVVEEFPEGREIRESVNGVVSLAKIRPQKIRPDESNIVEQALRRHPKGHLYRSDIRDDLIVVYESVGPDVVELIEHFSMYLKPSRRREMEANLYSEQERRGRWEPIMRFILEDEATRVFGVERMAYFGGEVGWWGFDGGELEELCNQFIPKLGTDDFFDLI